MNGVRVSNAKKWMGREGGKVVEFTRMGWHNGISPDSPEQAEAFLTFCELSPPASGKRRSRRVRSFSRAMRNFQLRSRAGGRLATDRAFSVSR